MTFVTANGHTERTNAQIKTCNHRSLWCDGASAAHASMLLHVPNLGFETMPFLIAEDRGYYAKQGIKLERTTERVELAVMAVSAAKSTLAEIFGLSLRRAIDKGPTCGLRSIFNAAAPTACSSVRRFDSTGTKSAKYGFDQACLGAKGSADHP